MIVTQAPVRGKTLAALDSCKPELGSAMQLAGRAERVACLRIGGSRRTCSRWSSLLVEAMCRGLQRRQASSGARRQDAGLLALAWGA